MIYFQVNPRNVVTTLLAVGCASVLCVVVVKDLMAVWTRATRSFTSFQFVQTPQGLYQESTIVLSAFEFNKTEFRSGSFSFYKYCSCSKMYITSATKTATSQNQSLHCDMFEFPAQYPVVDKSGSVTKYTFYVLVIAAPVNYARSEYLNLTCNTPKRAVLTVSNIPVSMTQALDFASRPDDAIEFFNKNFIGRPNRYLSGGAFSLIKLRELQFADINGIVASKDRHIYTDISRAVTSNKLFSEIIVSWDTDMIEIVSRVKSGNMLQVAKVISTFLLTLERLYSIRKKFNDRGTNWYGHTRNKLMHSFFQYSHKQSYIFSPEEKQGLAQ